MNPIKRHRWGKRSAVAATAVAGVFAVAAAEHPGLLHAAPLGIDSALSHFAPKPTIAPNSSVAKLGDLSDAFATIAAQIKPSVVYITARQAAEPVVNRQRSGRGQRGQQAPDL